MLAQEIVDDLVDIEKFSVAGKHEDALKKIKESKAKYMGIYTELEKDSTGQ